MSIPMDEEAARKVIERLNFRHEVNGEPLVVAVAQDADEGKVLMVAYANEEAVFKTLTTGKAHYWSTSREEVWCKGETSGHVQRVKEVRVDCDADAILYLVRQEGGACHKGYRTCFYRRVSPDGDLEIVEEKVFDPESVYGSKLENR